MKDTVVASRYARALFAAAKKPKQAETVREELEMVVKTLRGQANLWKLLNHPLVSWEEKKASLTKTFGSISETTANFLALLVKKRRMDFLPHVVYNFAILDDETKGILRAKAESAFPLSDDLRKKLEEGLSRWSGKKVSLDLSENPGLLGGVLIKVGDKILDGSVLNQLRLLEMKLAVS